MARQNMKAAAFRKFHRDRGESYRWWKAIPVGEADIRTAAGAEGNTGLVYVEQTVEDAWRVLVGYPQFEYDPTDFGRLARITAALDFMPDEANIQPGDRLLFPGMEQTTRRLVTRGAGSSDALPLEHVLSVAEVRSGQTEYEAGTDWELSGDSITWLVGDAPAVGKEYAVELTFSPLFVFTGATQLPRKGADGVLMPLQGRLEWLRNKD